MAKKIKEIFPNPLLTSVVEVRFASQIKSEEVLDKFYKLFGEKYPNVAERKVPDEVKKQLPDFQYLADYTLSNNDYSISVGNNVISFENTNTYTLWPNYFNVIKEGLTFLKEANLRLQIQRVGLRYASLFEHQGDIFDIVNLKLNIEYDNFKQSSQQIKVTLTKNDIQLCLQTVADVTASRGNDERHGVFMDIDVSQSINLPTEIGDPLFNIIETLHNEEKNLFHYVLIDSNLKNYKITYE